MSNINFYSFIFIPIDEDHGEDIFGVILIIRAIECRPIIGTNSPTTLKNYRVVSQFSSGLDLPIIVRREKGGGRDLGS